MLKLLFAISLIFAMTFDGMAHANDQVYQFYGMNNAIIQWCDDNRSQYSLHNVDTMCDLANEYPDSLIINETEYDNVLQIKLESHVYYVNIDSDIVSNMENHVQNYLKQTEIVIR